MKNTKRGFGDWSWFVYISYVLPGFVNLSVFEVMFGLQMTDSNKSQICSCCYY